MIRNDQLWVERRVSTILTPTNTIIELGCHVEILVARGVVRFVEGAAVSNNVGDIVVLPVAKLGIAIARDATSRGCGH